MDAQSWLDTASFDNGTDDFRCSKPVWITIFGGMNIHNITRDLVTRFHQFWPLTLAPAGSWPGGSMRALRIHRWCPPREMQLGSSGWDPGPRISFLKAWWLWTFFLQKKLHVNDIWIYIWWNETRMARKVTTSHFRMITLPCDFRPESKALEEVLISPEMFSSSPQKPRPLNAIIVWDKPAVVERISRFYLHGCWPSHMISYYTGWGPQIAKLPCKWFNYGLW